MVWKKKLFENFYDGNSGSLFNLSVCSNGYMAWKKILFEVLKIAAMVAQQ